MADRTILPDYFVSPEPQLWMIDEHGEAIDWKDSQSTAIMLPHLKLLCRAMADQLRGLPSLTAIVFIVDALSKGWTIELSEQRLSRLTNDPSKPGRPKHSTSHIAKWLHALQDLDAECRHGARAHAAFLCELFEQLPRDRLMTSPEITSQSMQWLESLSSDGSDLLATSRLAEDAARIIAWNTLEFASTQTVDAEAMRLRMRTGLNHLPAAAKVEALERFPIATMAKNLATRRDDVGAVARLAQDISATLSLPRLPSDPDVLPIGGVSDVTNRGQPDRLLMSELALDSDLLIARIANGQALYLRREQPPQPEPKQRCLIIEAGIRMWGTMRLHSAALALGLCIAQERRGGAQLDVITAAGDQIWQEDFTRAAGIERFFGRLLVDVHPGAALMKLMRSESGELQNQPILLLSQATDRDIEFRRATQDSMKSLLVTRLEQSGWVELIERGSSGDTRLQRLRLEVAQQVLDSKQQDPFDLPAYVAQSMNHLRYTVPIVGDCVQSYDSEVQHCLWVLTYDRRAMHLDDNRLGAIEVGHVPKGRILASASVSPSLWMLVVESKLANSRLPIHQLVHVRANRGVSSFQLSLHGEHPAHVTYCFDREQLIRIGKQVTFLDTRNGVMLASDRRILSHLGCAIFGSTQICVAAREADKVRWHHLCRVPSLPGCAARLEHAIPVVYARDLSWTMRIDGRGTDAEATEVMIDPLARQELLRVNSSGTDMLVALEGVTKSNRPELIGSRKQQLVQLSLRKPKVTCLGERSPEAIAAFERSSQNLKYEFSNVRSRFHAISATDGSIMLHGRDGQFKIDVLFLTQGTFWGLPSKPAIVDANQIAFGPSIKWDSSRNNWRWTLRHASLPRGDAWLDSRGMLHLRATDGSELSLMLGDGDLSGWHSSSGTFGRAYFTGNLGESSHPSRNAVEWFFRFVRDQSI